MTSGARPGQQDRPDLIAQASGTDAMESPAGRGKLRTYLGIAPGVGKTYAMLRDARARRRSGVDTVVAHWERHGRPGTAAQLDDLEVLPARVRSPTGARALRSWTSTAVLDRRPQLALVDELAHAEPPGGAARQTLAGRRRAAGQRHRRLYDPQRGQYRIAGPGRLPDHRGAPGRAGAGSRSCGPARSRWSTWRRRRCGAAGPGPGRPGRAGGCGVVELFPLREPGRPAGARTAVAR